MRKTKTAEIDRELVRDNVVEDNVVRLKALLLANCIERWLELDYVMSKYPVEILDIKDLVSKWEGGRTQQSV